MWKEISSPDNEHIFTEPTRVRTELCSVGVVFGVQDAGGRGVILMDIVEICNTVIIIKY